jgi:hypothetical protein
VDRRNSGLKTRICGLVRRPEIKLRRGSVGLPGGLVVWRDEHSAEILVDWEAGNSVGPVGAAALGTWLTYGSPNCWADGHELAPVPLEEHCVEYLVIPRGCRVG